jgi:hypothetical protein
MVNHDGNRRSLAMLTDRRFRQGAMVLLFATAALQPMSANAITVEVAKKCNVLLAKQFPPRQGGNPAAGSSKGSAQDQRDYFKKCVDSGGNPDGNADKK